MPRLRSPHRHATARKRSADKRNTGAGLHSCIPFAKEVLGYYSSGLARVNSTLFKWFGRDRYPEDSHGRLWSESCSRFPCHMLLSLDKERRRRHGTKRSAGSNALVLMPCSNVKHAAILHGRHHTQQSNRSGLHRVRRKMLKNFINESKSRSRRIIGHIESEPLCSSSNVSMDELNALSNGHSSTLTNTNSSEEDRRKIRCLTNTSKRFKSCCDNKTSKNRKETHSGRRNQTCVMCSDSAGSKLIMKTDSPANLIVWPVGSHTQRYSVGSSSQDAERCLCTTLALPHYTEDGVAYYKRGPCKCGSSKKKYAARMPLDGYTVDIDQPPEKDIQNNEIKVIIKSKNILPNMEKNSTLVDSQNIQNVIGTSPAKHEEKRYSSKLNPVKPDFESNEEVDYNILKEFPKSEPVAPKLDVNNVSEVELTFVSKADIKNNSKILPGNNVDVSVGIGNDTPIESFAIEQTGTKRKSLLISMDDDDFIPISSNGFRKYSNVKKKSVCMPNDADYFTDFNRQLPTSTQYKLCDGSCLPNETSIEDTKITKSDCNQTSGSFNSHSRIDYQEKMIEPNPSLRCDVVIDEVNKNTASIHCSEFKVEMEKLSVASVNTVFGNLETANVKNVSVEAAYGQKLLDNIVNGLIHIGNIESHEPPITLNDVQTNSVPDNSKYTRNITIGFKDKRTFKEKVNSTFLRKSKMFDSCEGCDLRIQKTVRLRPSISKETNKISIDTHVSSSKTAQALITPSILTRVKSNCKIATKHDEWIQELGTAKWVYPYSNYPTSETGSNSSSPTDSYIRSIKRAMKYIKNDRINSPASVVDNMPNSNLKNSIKYGIQTKQNSSLINNRKRLKNATPVLNANSQDVIVLSPKPRYNCAEMIPASSCPIVKIVPGGFQYVVISDLNWLHTIMEHFDISSNLESISTKRELHLVKPYEDKQDLITEEEPSGIINMKHRKNHELGLIHLPMLRVSAETSSSMVTLSPVFSSCNETEPSMQKINNDQSQNQARPKSVKLACDCVPFLSSNAYIHQPWCNSRLLPCIHSKNSPTILQTYKPKPLQDLQYHRLFNFVDELQSPSGVRPLSSTSGQSYFKHVVPTNYKYASEAIMHLFFQHALSIQPPLHKTCCVLLKPYISHHLVVLDYTRNHQSDSNANIKHPFNSLTAKPVRSILVTNKPTKGPNKQKMICFEASPRPSLIIETFTAPPFSFCRPLFKQYCQKTQSKIDSLKNNTSIIRMIRKITMRHLYVIHPIRRYKCIKSTLPKPIDIINMFIVSSYSYCEEHLTALHQSCEHIQESIQIVINIPTAYEHPVCVLPTSAIQEVHLFGKMTCSFKPRRRPIQHTVSVKSTLLTMNAKIEQFPYAVKIYNWSWSVKTFRHFALDMKVKKPDRIVTSYVLHTSFRSEVHMLCVQTCTYKITKRKENFTKFLRHSMMVFLPKPLFICRILHPSKLSHVKETFVIRPLLPKSSHLPRTHLNFSVFIQRWKKFVTASQMKLRTLDRRNSSESNFHVDFVESAAASRLLPSHPYYVDVLTVSSNTSSYLDASSLSINDLKHFDKNRPAPIIQSEICVETQTTGSIYRGIYKRNHKLAVDRNPTPENIEVFIQPIIQRFIFMYPMTRAELHMKPNQRSIELPTNNDSCSYALYSVSKKADRCKYGFTNDSLTENGYPDAISDVANQFKTKVKGNNSSNELTKAEQSFHTLRIKPNTSTTSVMYKKISKYRTPLGDVKRKNNLDNPIGQVTKKTDDPIQSSATQVRSQYYNKLRWDKGNSINQIPALNTYIVSAKFGSTNTGMLNNDYRRINTETTTCDGHKSISNVLIAANQTKWYRINDKNICQINNNHQNDICSSNGSQKSEESCLKIIPNDNNKEAYLSKSNLSETLLNTIIPNVESTQLSSHCGGSSTDIYIKPIVATSLHKPSSKYKNFSAVYKSKEYRSRSPEEQKESHNYIYPNLIQNENHDRQTIEKDILTTSKGTLYPDLTGSQMDNWQPPEKDIPTTYKDIDFLNGKFYTLKGFRGENGETVVLCDNNTPRSSTVPQSCQPRKDQHSSTFVDRFLPLNMPYNWSSGSQDPTENRDIKGIHRIDYTSNRSHELTAKFKDSSTTTDIPYDSPVIPAKFKSSSATTGIHCYEPSVIPTRFKNSSTTTDFLSYETPVVKNNYCDTRYKRKYTCSSSMVTSGNASKCCTSTNTFDSSDISSISPDYLLTKSLDLSELKHHEFMDTPDNMVRLNRPVFSPDESQFTHISKSFNPQHQSTSTTQVLTNVQCQTSIGKTSYLSSSTFGNIPITQNSGCADKMLWKESISKKYHSEAGILKAPQSKVNPMRHLSCFSSPHDIFTTRKKPARPKTFPSPPDRPISRRQAAGIRNKLSPGKSSFLRESISPCLIQNASHHTSSPKPLRVRRSDCSLISSNFKSNTNILPKYMGNPMAENKPVCSRPSEVLFSKRKYCDTQTSSPIFDFTPSEDTSSICYQPSRSSLICNGTFLPKYQNVRKFQISTPNVGPAEGRRVPKLSRFKNQGSLTKCQQRQSMFDIPFCQTQTSVCSESSQDEDPPSPICLPEPSRQCFKPHQLQLPVCNKSSEFLIIKPRECSTRRAPLPPPRFDFIPCKRPPSVCGQPTDLLIIKKSKRVPPRRVPPPLMYKFVPCQTSRPPTCNKPSELLIIKKNKCPPRRHLSTSPMFDFAPCQSRPPVCKKYSELLIIKKNERPPQKVTALPPMFDFKPGQPRAPVCDRPSNLLLIKKTECLPLKSFLPPPMFNFKPCQVQPTVCSKPTELLLLKKRECPPPGALPPAPIFNFTPFQAKAPICEPQSKLLLLKKGQYSTPKGHPPTPMFDFSPCKVQPPVCKNPSELLLTKKFECPLPRAPLRPPMFDFKPCQCRSFVCNKPSALFLIKKNEYIQPKDLSPPSMFDFAPCQSRPPVFNKPSELLLLKKTDRPPPRNLPPPTMVDFKPCDSCSPISPESSELLLIKNTNCSTSRCNPKPSVFDFIPCNTDPSICTQTSHFNGSEEEIKRTNGNNISSMDYTDPASLNPHYIRHSKLVLMKPCLQGISAQNQRQHHKKSHGKNIRPPVSQRTRLKALMQKSFEVACKDRQIIPNYIKKSHHPTCSSLASITSVQSQNFHRDEYSIDDFNSKDMKLNGVRTLHNLIDPSTDGVEQLYQREGKLDITNFINRMTPSINSKGTIEALKILSGPPKWSGICASQVEQPGSIILTDCNQWFNFIPKNLMAKREFLRDSSNRNLSRSNFVRSGKKSSKEPLLLDSQNRNLLLRRTPLSPIKGSSPSESSGSSVDCRRTGHVKKYHRISSDETEVSLVDLQAQNELKKDDSSQCSCSDCDTFKKNYLKKVASNVKIKNSLYALKNNASDATQMNEPSHSSIYQKGYLKTQISTLQPNRRQWQINPPTLKRSYVTKSATPNSKANWRHRQLTSRILQKYGYASGLIRSTQRHTLPAESAPKLSTPLLDRKPYFHSSFSSCYNVSSQLMSITETKINAGNSTQSSDNNIQLERKLSLVTVPCDSQYDLLESTSVH